MQCVPSFHGSEVLLIYNTVALATYYFYAVATITFNNNNNNNKSVYCVRVSLMLPLTLSFFKYLLDVGSHFMVLFHLCGGSACTNNYSALHVQVGYVIKQNRRYICTIGIDLADFIMLCVMNATTSPHLH